MKRKTKLISQEPEKTLELKKHVAIIHAGSSKLSLLQRKIANALLFNAYKDLLTKDEHEIHISALCGLIGYESNDHKTIKKTLVNLLSTVLQWNLVDGERLELGEEGVWNASSIIADASIDGPICTYSYSNKMKKLLYRPNVYGRLDMLVQAKFQSGYGLALYENCNRFQDVGRTPWIEMEKFRLLMGIKEGQYKVFRDFKNRVIDKAVEEVNKYSPIIVEPQYRKLSRKITAIQFLIRKSSDNVIGMPRLIDDKSELPEILKVRFGFSKRQIESVLSDYELNYIYEKIELIENSSSYQSGKIQNLAKYLLSALSDDYQPNKKVKSVSDTQKDKHSIDNEFQKRQSQELDVAYQRYQDGELFKQFKKMETKKQAAILKQFEKHLTKNVGGLYLNAYERDGVNNVLIQDHLSAYLKQAMPDMLIGIKQFDDWYVLNLKREKNG